MRKYLTLMLSVVMVVMMSACGDADVSTVEKAEAEENESNDNVDNAENNSENNAEENDEEDAEAIFEPNETVSVDGIEITLNDITWGEEEEFVESDNGNIIRIDLTIKNNSDDNEFVDDTEFDLYDEEGNKLDAYFGNDDANMFGSEIKKGKQLNGILEYDAPESDSYELYYEPSFSFTENNEIIWLVENEDIK